VEEKAPRYADKFRPEYAPDYVSKNAERARFARNLVLIIFAVILAIVSTVFVISTPAETGCTPEKVGVAPKRVCTADLSGEAG
jgi:hypothetical protein